MEMQRNLAFEALIKEAQFIRDEALLCIETVRKLAVYSTYIAGFALPVVAGLISASDQGVKISNANELMSAVQKNLIIIQFVCLAVSLSCVAFLRIYVGSFLQIFNFARYFRQHLTPEIEKVVSYEQAKLFHWEKWLQEQRKRRLLAVGDSDLAAEPILIALYSLAYGAAFAALGYFGGSFPYVSLILFIGIVIIILSSFAKFVSVLRSSVN